MKKLFSLLAASLLVVAAFSPASAREKRSWEETQDYGPPAGVFLETEVGVAVGGVAFDVGRAKTVELTVEDSAAPATAIIVKQGEHDLGTYCTSTPEPIDLVSSETVHLYLMVGVCDGGPSFITTGQVRARFAR